MSAKGSSVRDPRVLRAELIVARAKARRRMAAPPAPGSRGATGRAASEGEVTLQGHAAIFNCLSDDLGGFREILRPGAFREALRSKPDVRFLINHEPSTVLARTKSGTLTVSEDAIGLRMVARIDPADPHAAGLTVKMGRGDIDQSSFAFTLSPDGDEWGVTDDDDVVRTILPGGINELFDVSAVTFPAYPAAGVAVNGGVRHVHPAHLRLTRPPRP
jgi:HK97 family phage prohead protease